MKFSFSLVLIFSLLALVASCNVKKSSALQSHYLQADSSTLLTKDSITANTSLTENKNITETKSESQISKTTEYNDSGHIVRIVEVVYLSDFNRLDMSQLFARSEILGGSATITSTNQTIDHVVNSSDTIDSDSRPVQGVEWLWIMLWVVVGIVLLWLIDKYLLRN